MDPESKRQQTERRKLIWLLAVVVALFALNGHWATTANPDVLAANIPSWQVARAGTLNLSEHASIVENLEQFDRWFVELPDGRVVSNRPPGLIAIALPAYVVLSSDRFSAAPGTLVALLTTVLALVFTWIVLKDLIETRRATITTAVLALGTPTWWISSAQLWPHGPDQLWSALAVLALSRSAYLGAGWAFAASITTRPITAVSAAIAGLHEGFRKRSIAPVLKVGSISAIGLFGVLLFNRAVFGAWSVTAPYFADDQFTSGAFSNEVSEGFSISSYVSNLFDLFLGLPHGVLVTTPIIGVAAVGAWLSRKSVPGWAVSAALAGLGYLVVHAALNRASGGLAVFYRYPLEAIVLAAPALAIGANTIWDSGRLGKRVVFASAAISIFLMVLYVFYLRCFYDPSAPLCIERLL